MWRSFLWNPHRRIVLYTCMWLDKWFLQNWRHTKIMKTFATNLFELFNQNVSNKIWNWFNSLNNIYWPQQQYLYVLSLSNIRFIGDRRIKATAKDILEWTKREAWRWVHESKNSFDCNRELFPRFIASL